MNLAEVLSVTEGKLISGDVDLSQEVSMACGADLMSDVLAFTYARILLLTGLATPQVERPAEIAGIAPIVFVRGRLPTPETVALARDIESYVAPDLRSLLQCQTSWMWFLAGQTFAQQGMPAVSTR